jgi:prepilin-type N-terminal cleavage/methylation domain-containing protein
MRRNPQSGVTLIEILVAVTLLSLLSLGVLIAMRLGLSTMDKTDRRIVSNRRVTGSRRIIESEIGSFLFTRAAYYPQPQAPVLVPFLEAEPRRMRFLSSYSLADAWRGRPQIVVLQVIPGERNQGVRLVLNETPYTGPDQAGRMITGIEQDPAVPYPIVHFAEVPANAQSFVLADRLAYCRFSYLEAHPQPPLRVWRPDWVDSLNLPLAIRIEMAPLDTNGPDLHVSTVTLPLGITRRPGTRYADQN